jgi:hypothetical protein
VAAAAARAAAGCRELVRAGDGRERTVGVRLLGGQLCAQLLLVGLRREACCEAVVDENKHQDAKQHGASREVVLNDVVQLLHGLGDDVHQRERDDSAASKRAQQPRHQRVWVLELLEHQRGQAEQQGPSPDDEDCSNADVQGVFCGGGGCRCCCRAVICVAVACVAVPCMTVARVTVTRVRITGCRCSRSLQQVPHAGACFESKRATG